MSKKLISVAFSLFALTFITGCEDSKSGSRGDYKYWGPGPEGTYHLPYAELESGETRPETLIELTKGNSTEYSVHNGAIVVAQREISYFAQELRFGNFEAASYDCKGLIVTKEAEEPLDGLEFQKQEASLEIALEGQKIYFEAATPEQVERIKALPHCEKLTM